MKGQAKSNDPSPPGRRKNNNKQDMQDSQLYFA
jgi:hypothetical protein